MTKHLYTALALVTALSATALPAAARDHGHDRGPRNRGYGAACSGWGQRQRDGERDDRGRDHRDNGYGNGGWNNGRGNGDDRNEQGSGSYGGPYGTYGNSGAYGNGQYGYGASGQYGYGAPYGCPSMQGNAMVRGMIVAVNGNQVAIAQSGGAPILVNDGPALQNRLSGPVAVGRYVVAFGYWQSGVFFATRIQ